MWADVPVSERVRQGSYHPGTCAAAVYVGRQYVAASDRFENSYRECAMNANRGSSLCYWHQRAASTEAVNA